MNKFLFMIKISILISFLSGCGGGEQSTIPTTFQQLGGGNLIIDGVPYEVATVQPRDRGDISTPDFLKVYPDNEQSDYLIQIPAYTLVNGVPDLTKEKILIKFYIMHYMPHMMIEYGYMPSLNFNHARPDSWNRDAQGNPTSPIPNEYGHDIVYPPNKGATVMLMESVHDDWGNPIYTGAVINGEFFADPEKTDENDTTVMITFEFKTMLFNKDDY